MTETEYMKILEPIDKAEESTRPFLVQSEKESMVVGDPNETEVKKGTLTVEFRMPTDDGYKIVPVEYKDVFIKPRHDTRIVRALDDILPFFRKLNPDGTVDKLNEEEAAQIFESVPEYIYDELYDMVALVLGVNEKLKDYMMVSSVISASTYIFRNLPRISK